MFFKLSVLAVVVFVQANVVFTQQQQFQPQPQQGQYQQQGMTATQMWDPNTWIMPFYTAASKAWTGYLEKAQEASNQLYKQWDTTGAADMFATGMKYAQQAAALAQKGAEAAMKQGAQMMPRENPQNW